MRIARIPGCHLTYCTNIHPGESWDQVFSQFRKFLPAVKHSVSPDLNFGVGARFSAQAVSELLKDDNLSVLKSWLIENGLYVFTLNGFPYGRFHQGRVKEKVYLPDWSSPERLEYSKQLAVVLAKLLPMECDGTISTVPVGLKSNFQNKEKVMGAVKNLFDIVAFLIELHEQTGKRVRLALEPEPGCYLETSEDVVSFFADYLLSENGRDWLVPPLSGELPPPELLLQYLGICLDTCHASVMYEKPKDVAKILIEKGIGIFKMQLTAALSVEKIDNDGLMLLQKLADPVYFHQTSISDAGRHKKFFLDLPEALEQISLGESLRIHYHIPVFAERIGNLGTSQKELIEFLDYFFATPFCQHLEVETYTFDVMPEECRLDSVAENITKELQWIVERIDR